MPKLTLYYPEGRLSDQQLETIWLMSSRLVAYMISTEKSPLTEDDVDFLPVPYGPQARFCQSVAIEIETFGFPARKAKLNEARARELRNELAIIVSDHIPVEPDKQLLWLKFQDPDGFHF